MHTRAVAMRPAGTGGGTELAENWQVHNTHHDIAVRFQRDEIGPQGIAAHVISSPIDWIDNPTPPAAGLRACSLFAENAVVGKSIAQHARDHPLAFAVRLRHGRLVWLGLSDDVGLIPQRQFGRCARGLGCDL